MAEFTRYTALAAVLFTTGFAHAQTSDRYAPMRDFAAVNTNKGEVLAERSASEQTVMGLRVPNGFRDRDAVHGGLPRY